MQGVSPGELPTVHQQWDYNLGDIILGMSVIQHVCGEDRVLLKHRLPVIVTHGLCHLLGYDHDNHHNWKLVIIGIKLFVHSPAYLMYMSHMKVMVTCAWSVQFVCIGLQIFHKQDKINKYKAKKIN